MYKLYNFFAHIMEVTEPTFTIRQSIFYSVPQKNV